MVKQEGNVFFWFSRLALTGLSGIFLALGIQVLIAAYHLNQPYYFIMVFFASNLMILISATLGLGFVLSMYRRLKWQPPQEEAAPEGEAEEPDNEPHA